MKTFKNIFAICTMLIIAISANAQQSVNVSATDVNNLQNSDKIATVAPRELKTNPRWLGFGSYREYLDDEGYGVLRRYAGFSIKAGGGMHYNKVSGTMPTGMVEVMMSTENFRFGLEGNLGKRKVETTPEFNSDDFNKVTAFGAQVKVYWDFLKYKGNSSAMRSNSRSDQYKPNRPIRPFRMYAFALAGYEGFSFDQPDVYHVKSNSFVFGGGLGAELDVAHFKTGNTTKGFVDRSLSIFAEGKAYWSSQNQCKDYTDRSNYQLNVGLRISF